MSNKEKIKKEIIYKVNCISKKGIVSPINIRQKFSEDFIGKIDNKKYHSLIADIALEYKQKNNFGRLKILLILCFTLDKDCFEVLEAKRVLLTESTYDQKLIKMLLEVRKL